MTRFFFSRRSICISFGLFVAAVLSATPASAQKCEATKLLTAGKHYQCRMNAESKAVKKNEPASGFDKCSGKYAKKWTKAENAGGCPVSGDEAAIEALVDGMTDALTATLVPAPPVTDDGRKCGSGKLKAGGKYASCRLKAHSKNVKSGKPLDFTKCEANLTKQFGKAEASGGGDCPSTGDEGAIAASVTGDADLVAATIAGPVVTTTTTTTLPATVPEIGTLIYSEDFADTDGTPWPAPWVVAGGVDTADILGDRARFRPTVTGYSLARMHMPGGEQDVDVRATVEWGDFATQGLGFYVRQNGGFLQVTPTHGEGYAIFVEGFTGTDGVGVWKEIDGNEISLNINYGLPIDIQTGVPHHIRFRAYQANASSTRLLAKAWTVGTPEPAMWLVDHTDNDPILQNLTGGYALDAWYNATMGPPDEFQFVDDVEIRTIENPLLGIGAVDTIQETFVFTEGPHWRSSTSELLFTDIDANTIYSLVPPSTVNVFRTPSDNANGLATADNGDLLAAEHGTRRVSRTDGVGTVTAVVDMFGGSSLNSPNDIEVRSDGTIYFTDPPFGIDPGDQELAFNGVFRIPAGGGALAAEWMAPLARRPNGVVLSPDESRLYVSDTFFDDVTVFSVMPDGSLGASSTFATGVDLADGMCVDTNGNIYVAASTGIEVFAPDGMHWGTIAFPRIPSNCAFGGVAATTLYVTAREGLYSVDMVIPGIP